MNKINIKNNKARDFFSNLGLHTIQSKITFFSVLFLIIILLFAGIIFFQNYRTQKAIHLIRPLHIPISELTSKITNLATEIELDQQSFLIAKDDNYNAQKRKRKWQDLTEARKELENLKSFLNNNEKSKQLIDEITDLIKQYENSYHITERYSLGTYKKDIIKKLIISDLLPKLNDLKSKLAELNTVQGTILTEDVHQIERSLQISNLSTWIVALLIAFISTILAILLIRSIKESITQSITVLKQISRGEIVENIQVPKDELGKVVVAGKRLSNNLGLFSQFAQSIGKSNFDHHFTPLSNKDVLGNSLIQMRDKLKEVSKEDKKRNWATEGYAKFSEILRYHAENFEDLGDNLLPTLIEYLKANQGAFFLVDEIKKESVTLDLLSCYAYEKKKILEQNLDLNTKYTDNLLAQAFSTQKIIHLNNLPTDYMNIHSGLGETKAKNLLILPLKLNNQVEGIIEIASLNVLEEYQITFLEQLASSIAATISSTRANQKTKELLVELKSQTELMKAQEDEMRSNLKKLNVAQEQMKQADAEKEKLLQDVQRLANIVEYHPDFIASLDLYGNITYINPSGLKMLGYHKDYEIGKMHLEQIQEAEVVQKILKDGIRSALKDGTWSQESKIITQKQQTINVAQTVGINYNKNRQPTGFNLTMRDISKQVLQRKELEEKNIKLTSNEQKLRDNMEELVKAQQEKEIAKKAEIEKNQEMLRQIELHRKTLLSILDRIPGKIFLKDKQGVILLANSAVAKVYNRTVEQLLGTTDSDFFEEDLAQSYREQELEIMELGAKTYIQEEELTGELRFLKTTKMPFYVPYKEEQGLLGIQIDVTDMLNNERKLRKSEKENKKLQRTIQRLQKLKP